MPRTADGKRYVASVRLCSAATLLLLPSTALAHDPEGFGAILLTAAIAIHLCASLLLSVFAAAFFRTTNRRSITFARTFIVTFLGAPLPQVLLFLIPGLDSDLYFIATYLLTLPLAAYLGCVWAKPQRR